MGELKWLRSFYNGFDPTLLKDDETPAIFEGLSIQKLRDLWLNKDRIEDPKVFEKVLKETEEHSTKFQCLGMTILTSTIGMIALGVFTTPFAITTVLTMGAFNLMY